MLDQKTFLQGINYLKANYINWAFDLNNDLMLKVWFKKLSNLENKTYMSLVEKYTDTRRYAPNSPAELLEVLTDEYIKKELNANEAWGKYLELTAKYNFPYTYDRDNFFKELDQTPALKKTILDLERELHYNKIRDQYFIDSFKKAYTTNVKNYVATQTCKLIGSNILLLK